MQKLLFILTLVFWWPVVAMAQESTPLIGSQATEPVITFVAPENVEPFVPLAATRVLVIGDAMAGGLGAGIARMALNDGSFQIVSRFNESSAITRPDIYDWATAIPKIMDGKEFDAVVVLIGLNDRQDIRSAAGRLKFNTAEWITAYRANTDAIIAALVAQKVKVFWLGEPPMGDANYDADMRLVTSLQKDRVVAQGATFIDTRFLLSNSDGSYMEFGPDDTGEVKKLRQRDGVTFLKQGNNKFGQIVLAAIKAGDFTQPAEVTPTPIALGPMAIVPPIGVQIPGPVFGQIDAKGDELLHESNDLIALAAAGNLQSAAAPTTVDKLFTEGESNVAPSGRFDDFSYRAPVAN